MEVGGGGWARVGDRKKKAYTEITEGAEFTEKRKTGVGAKRECHV